MGTVATGRNGRPQVRAERKDGWNKTRRAIFLSELGESCNVTQAAKAAGLTTRSAHALRKRDGEFAMAWARAMEGGYDRLSDDLLACALGQRGTDSNPGAAEIAAAGEAAEGAKAAVPFDPALAIKVLQLRGDRRLGVRSAGAVISRPKMTQSEVDAALLERLDALAAKRP